MDLWNVADVVIGACIGPWIWSRIKPAAPADPITIEYAEKRRVLERMRDVRLRSISTGNKASQAQVNAAWVEIDKFDAQLIELAEEERMLIRLTHQEPGVRF